MLKRYSDIAVCMILLVLAGCSSLQFDRQADAPAITPTLQDNYLAALELMDSGEWQAAREQLEPITSTHPALSGPWLNLGITQLQLGDEKAAEHAFLQALEANPGNAEACNQLGIMHRRAGRLEEARRFYEAALANAPDYPNAHWNLGILHDRYLGNPQLALQHYERYQAITASGDPQLQAWIDELRKQVQAEAMTAKAKP
jgi:tetratricopeptide (TPR) repeat protein